MAANWINTCDGSPQTPTNVSRGVFGATLNAQQQLDVLTRSINAVTNFTGKKPKGYTAPLWATSKELIPQLQDAGILYDHSFMHHDVQPYWAPDTLAFSWVETNVANSASSWMMPMTTMKPSKVVELLLIPSNWHLDDWPPLNPIPDMGWAQGYVDTHSVERLWKEQFDFAYREYDEFIFPMSIHPQVSGKPQVIMMHERIIEHINKHPGVEWMTLSGMAEEFVAGRIAGANIEGGVDPSARI
ncbi:Peptidoglycan deacetylase [Pseudocercospora fuligena]|uniref:Peptidoglycan deacetylase n=1 Tax=Pseudocercospora fuligena TaxID=685502 RepID=A0A8H6R8L8_9PEZI|nr:Peptidoglycan deacetylase [Pseudocercospora fuligena]